MLASAVLIGFLFDAPLSAYRLRRVVYHLTIGKVDVMNSVVTGHLYTPYKPSCSLAVSMRFLSC